MMKFLPFAAILLLTANQSAAQAVTPFPSCPNGSFAIARAGMNADVTNPYYIYAINTSKGTVTQQPGGPLYYPGTTTTLQVNGVGLNSADGFFYGLAQENTTARFVRFDINYGVTPFGNVMVPTSPTGAFAFVNTAAGDVDRSDNYWFTAATANFNPASPSGVSLDRLYLGRISNISSLAPGATPVVQYFEIDVTDANCSEYVSTLSSDPSNSGIKDIVYNPFTNTLMAYTTYRTPGSPNYSGVFFELVPIAGSAPVRYRMVCSPKDNTQHQEVAGNLIDNSGNFLVLLTDGTIGKLKTTASYQYTGQLQPYQNSTGMPGTIRGDMAGCAGANQAPLPVKLTSFNLAEKDCNTTFTWTADGEVNFSRYELEQSTDNVNFTSVSNIAANRNSNKYQVNLPSAGKEAYYRLKMVDVNGNYSYSQILVARNSCAQKFGFVVSPNPVRGGTLSLNWHGVTKGAQVEVVIHNATGSIVSRAMKSLPEGNSNLTINIDNLSAGTYLIKAVDTKTNSTYTTKFVKQ